MKPNGMMPAARAANTAICFGIDSASASGEIPAEVAKSSAPRLSATEPRVGAGDLGDAEERRGGLDHRDQPRRPRRHAALGLDLVDDLGDEPHMLGAVDLGQGQRQHAGADRRLDVAHRQAQRPVDANHDIGTAARDDLGRLGHQRAGPLLLRGGDAVLEIEDDRVGAAPGRAIDKAPRGHRHEQQRAPDRQGALVTAASPQGR